MLQGHIDHPHTYQDLLASPMWQQALTWIQQEAQTLPEGEHEISGRDLYANIHSAELLPREQGVYEAHQNYIDLHFCLSGGEVIEWAPATTLKPRTEYDAAKDYTLFELPTQASTSLMTPGSFAVYFPHEAHMPKITDGQNTAIKKVVVKIKLTSLA